MTLSISFVPHRSSAKGNTLLRDLEPAENIACSTEDFSSNHEAFISRYLENVCSLIIITITRLQVIRI